jgi:uncharacterized protein with von Willebrand factor type A (vWA) domain
MDDFLDGFGKPAVSEEGSRRSIHTDRWDAKVARNIESEFQAFKVAATDLQGITPTGYEAMSDAFMAIYKTVPRMIDEKEIRPSFLVNRKVMDEFVGLREYEQLHIGNCGDPISAGLAACAMEPDLEVLFTKLRDENDLAEQLEKQLQELEGLQGDAAEIAEQLASAGNSGQEQEAVDYQEQLDAINEKMEALQNDIANDASQLQDSLENKSGIIADSLASAADAALEQSDALSMADQWGLQRGGVYSTDPSARLELAKRLNTEKFRLMSEIFGRMQSVALSAQMNKVDNRSEEIYEITQGRDIMRMLPSEAALLADDDLILDFLRKFFEGALLQYDLKGTEETEKGGIIMLEDGSGSMSGQKTIKSKATALALLKIAAAQNRPFHALHFAGHGHLIDFDFDTSQKVVSMCRDGGPRMYGIDAILNFAETLLNGGTDFRTPLARALDILQDEFDETGAVEGDIVFLTDGHAGVDPTFLEEFHRQRERLGFNVYGIAIGTNPLTEPFNSICGGRVIDWEDVASSKETDLRAMFGAI